MDRRDRLSFISSQRRNSEDSARITAAVVYVQCVGNPHPVAADVAGVAELQEADPLVLFQPLPMASAGEGKLKGRPL